MITCSRRPLGGVFLRVAFACLPLTTKTSWPAPAQATKGSCCTSQAHDGGPAKAAIAPAVTAKCVGAADCRACKNCSSCAWCSGGGTCGVCASNKAPAPKPKSPSPPADPNPSRVAPASPPAAAPPAARRFAATENGVTARFSPKGGCTDALIQGIAGAQRSIKVLSHRLSSPLIVEALFAAKQRGVAITIVLDRSQQTEQASDATPLAKQGLNVRIDDGGHTLASQQFMVIDDSNVFTGSVSFTIEGELKVPGTLLQIEAKPTIARAFADEFKVHLDHSALYRLPASDSR